MCRAVSLLVLLLSLLVTDTRPRADERAEAMALLREALAAVERADKASAAEERLRSLETAAAIVARLVRDYAATYVGLRLAAGQPIGALDPAALERRLAEARGTVARRSGPPPSIELPRRPADGVGRPCDRGVVAATRRGETGTTLAEVIADCRTALAFEPASPRLRFQLARALSERGQPGDREEAVRLLEAAAADGWTPAKAELCARYWWGIGTAKDPARARLLCEAAAAEGSEQARALLAGGGALAAVRR
jgi:TPR repeat protein